MNTRSRRLASIASLLLVASARAQIIVHDGDDLVAIVAAAPSGSVIEIHGQGPFPGLISWEGKTLVLQAGAGFTPTILGGVDLEHAHPTTSGTFIGLTVVGDVVLLGTSLTAEAAIADFVECDLRGMVHVDGTGDIVSTLRIAASRLRGMCLISGTGSITNDVSISDCELQDRLLVGGTGQASSTLRMIRSKIQDTTGFGGTGTASGRVWSADCEFARTVTCSATSSYHAEIQFQRCRMRGGLDAEFIVTSSLQLDSESCLLIGSDAAAIGALVQGNVSARFVNATITGFGIGVQPNASTTFENAMIFGNATGDVGVGVSAAQIANSLIEDGTFAGQNGNFGGTPRVGPDFVLLPGSIGVDAGNSAAAGLGRLDLYGRRRFRDGDADGIAIVDVGAAEL